jgi:hypothetical protein
MTGKEDGQTEGNSVETLLLAALRQFHTLIHAEGARGGVVVEALRYKPEGRGFDFRWCHWIFH